MNDSSGPPVHSERWYGPVDWSIEAYRHDTGDLAWELLLTGLTADDLERDLNILLPTPAMFPITVAQMVTAIRSSQSDADPDALKVDGLSLYLSATSPG